METKVLTVEGFKGFKPKKGTVLLEVPETTNGGIILPNGGSTEDSLMVVAIAEDITDCKPGDFIVGVGNGVRLLVNDKPYFLVYASGIMGIVEPGNKVVLDIPQKPNLN